MKDKKLQLPIQEDETALVLWALWQHFVMYKDIEFIKPLYRPLIKNAADFMMNCRNLQTRLPLPSYDLWEERLGVHAFTCGAVFAGLNAAANFTEVFGETDLATAYRDGAKDLKNAVEKFFYDEKSGRFVRTINFNKNGDAQIDYTIDSSLYGLSAFGTFDARDKMIENIMNKVLEKLWCGTDIDGLCRYENDYYYRVSDKLPGNP